MAQLLHSALQLAFATQTAYLYICYSIWIDRHDKMQKEIDELLHETLMFGYRSYLAYCVVHVFHVSLHC